MNRSPYDQISKQIEGAIRLGAPVFNQGDARGCFELYEKTYVSLLRDPLVNNTQEVQSTLTKFLGRVEKSVPVNYERNAWTLRVGFDESLGQLRKLEAARAQGGARRASGRGRPSGGGPAHSGGVLFDFSSEAACGALRELNDGVMGGLSTGTFRFDTRSGSGLFSGSVRTENRGGFAFVRAGGLRADVHGWGGFVLEVRTPPTAARKTFLFVVKDRAATAQGICFQVEFEVPGSAEQFAQVRIPMAAFRGRAEMRGTPVDRDDLNLRDIAELGFMLRGARHAGPFALYCRKIALYTA